MQKKGNKSMTSTTIVNEKDIRTLQRVKANFILKGTSFHEYCKNNDIDHGSATKALTKKWTGPKAKVLRSKIIADSKAKPAKPENTEQSMSA
jgi:hypothetical protein